MCGILGWFNLNSCYLEEDISRMSRSLKLLNHRGPNYAKIEIVNESLVFAHSRLSIIDLSDNSNQPFYSKCGRFCIVFNGEIYNYIELRDDLISKGFLFHTDGDTEATHESVAVACAPVFSVDDVPIRVGNAVRVVYEDRESETILTVILTHEGIIMDVWDAYANEPTATSSITYDEQLISMLGS